MFNTLALISVLTAMFMLQAFVSIFPSIMGAAIRWKESINIEASVKSSRDRDFSALVLMLPFCLTVFRFRIYNPSFIAGLSDDARLWAILAIFAAYLIFRKTAFMLVHPGKISQKAYVAAEKSAYTFFILLTLALLAFGSVASFCDASLQTIKIVCLWLSALIYGLYILRKLQILTSSCSLFTGFLYLCALEILPTCILVVSGVIF